MKRISALLTALFSITILFSQTEWTQITTLPNQQWLSIAHSGVGIWLTGTLGNAHESADLFITHNQHTTNTFEVMYDTKSSSTIDGWICGSQGTVLVSNDNGNTWINRSPPTTSDLLSVHSRSSQLAMVVGDNGTAFWSPDLGENWTDTSVPINKDLHAVVAPQIGGATFIVAGEDGTLMKTIDTGTNWTQATISTTENLNCAAQGAFSRVFIGGNNGVLLYSDDLGDTWTETNVGSTENILGISTFNGGGGQVVVCGTNGMLFESLDNGVTWTEMCSPTIETLRGVVYRGGIQNYMIIVGDNGTVWRSDNATEECNVGIEELSAITELNIFPIPAKDKVTINFNLLRNQSIVLQILNSIGQVTLEKNLGLLSTGDHHIDIEIDLPAGIYELNLKSSNLLTTRQLVVTN